MLGWALVFSDSRTGRGIYGLFRTGRLGGDDRQVAVGGVPDPSDRQRFFRRAEGQTASLIWTFDAKGDCATCVFPPSSLNIPSKA